MASQNYPRNYSVSDMKLNCELCNSSEIQETDQGYVCTSCGLVLDVAKMEYHYPYKEERLQHAVLSSTKIGYPRERYECISPHKYRKLNKINTSSRKTRHADIDAKIIIKRLLEVFNLSPTLKRVLFTKYKRAREALPARTKFRNPEKLVPAILYFHCKVDCLPIDERKLIEYSDIDMSDFRTFKLNVNTILPKYYSRDRKEYILTRMMQIREKFNLGMQFCYDARNLLTVLWEEIKCTKDDVIVGLISSIIVLCHDQYDINVNSICKTLNITMSTIHSQVKRKFITPFGISGFRGLVSSANLLQEVMKELGLLTLNDRENSESKKEEKYGVRIRDKKSKDPKKMEKFDKKPIKVQTQNVQTKHRADIIFMGHQDMMSRINSQKRIQYHIFAFRDETTLDPIVFVLKIHPPEDSKMIRPQNKSIGFKIAHYHLPKGPPNTPI